MVDERPHADRLLIAMLTGTAGRHARWRDLTAEEEEAAVAKLRELAAGRADLLAEVAGAGGPLRECRRCGEACTAAEGARPGVSPPVGLVRVRGWARRRAAMDARTVSPRFPEIRKSSGQDRGTREAPRPGTAGLRTCRTSSPRTRSSHAAASGSYRIHTLRTRSRRRVRGTPRRSGELLDLSVTKGTHIGSRPTVRAHVRSKSA